MKDNSRVIVCVCVVMRLAIFKEFVHCAVIVLSSERDNRRIVLKLNVKLAFPFPPLTSTYLSILKAITANSRLVNVYNSRAITELISPNTYNYY